MITTMQFSTWTRHVTLLAACVSSVAGCSSEKAKPRPPDFPDPVVKQPREDKVVVPEGWYTAGCPRVLQPKDGDTAWREKCVRENPPRRVWVSRFEIDRYEATWAEFRACARADACTDVPRLVGKRWMTAVEDEQSEWEWLTRWWAEIEPELPAIVPWAEAVRYCAWRKMRLPTEAEWEKAARGSDERIFPWGDQPATCDRASFWGDRLNRIEGKCPGYSLWTCPRMRVGKRYDGPFPDCMPVDRSHRPASKQIQYGEPTETNPQNLRTLPPDGVIPVGTHPSGKSAFGVHDMYGNAGEWVSDTRSTKASPERFNSYRYAQIKRNGYALLIYDWKSVRFRWRDPVVVDPRGPTEAHGRDDDHVVKGDPSNPSIAARHWASRGAGIRCVRSLPGAKPPTIPPVSNEEYVFPFREPAASPPASDSR